MKNIQIQNVNKEADSILMCPKEVFEAGVTLDVRTSEASIPQESPVRSENPIIFENQAHQDNVKYPLVEDEAPDESAGSETVESEISTTISLIKNSASASTEKTIPEKPRTMEALTIPDASRIICSADMGGSEEDTIALAKQDEPSHSAEPQDPNFNLAMQREMGRLQKMHEEMHKNPFCKSFCPRPDDNFPASRDGIRNNSRSFNFHGSKLFNQRAQGN
ncbi:hypothetical protein L5515_017152 [Caenorhabditis briggsae]|uniref:Uncharacterized protein n=1 Tax=Caenorhabditis briggsae TaxID=6238 RepID=A0AAE9FCL0_CAEBR|nr:hypothetical protein L5515_017152 [Caenorhabditis briggsae]